MGLFSFVKKAYTYTVDRVKDVAETAVTAVVDVAKTAVGATIDAGQREVTEVVGKTVDTVEKVVGDAIDYTVKTTDAIVGGSFNTVGSGVGTVTGLISNIGEIGSDLLNGRVELADYRKLVVDAWQGTSETISSGWGVSSATVKLVGDINKAANEGGSLSLGDSNGLIGLNLSGSLLGGNTDQGVIPDTRGTIGPVPINVSFSDQGINFGGEVPITPFVTAALAAFPLTTALVPFLVPLNLGGIGVIGSIDKEGFTAKFYGIAGPSYSVGVAKVATTIELGSYTDVNLLSWNDKTVADLPIIGSILGQIPVIKDISFSLPKLDLQFDSKLYAQGVGSIDVLGKGPQGQIELVTDIDHSVGVLAGIAGKTALSAVDGVVKVAGAAVGYDDAAAPAIQLIGSDTAAQEQALAA